MLLYVQEKSLIFDDVFVVELLEHEEVFLQLVNMLIVKHERFDCVDFPCFLFDAAMDYPI